jgi:PhnB protein
MQLNPSLHFSGNAEEVLEHYRNALGGKVEIARFEGSPAAGQVPPDWKGKVLYGTLQSPAGVIAAMDAPPGREGKPGDNFSLSVTVDDAKQAEDAFSKLSNGGNVSMPLEETFFAQKFGMCVDKFGIRWMINYPRN